MTAPQVDDQGHGGGGGSATAGGVNFQAATTAIAAIYMARGVPLGWLSGLSAGVGRRASPLTNTRSRVLPAWPDIRRNVWKNVYALPEPCIFDLN
jgi:hypothetical protein